MKFNASMILWICPLFYLIGCAPSDFVGEQEQISMELSQSIESSLQVTKNTVADFSKNLMQHVSDLKNCKKIKENKQYSSMYYPKSAIINQRTTCFVQATQLSEKDWYQFFQASDYVSWIYSFDAASKVKRITPAAKVKFLFGPDLMFDSFSFYKDAVAQYPMVTWTAVKEDINGTGRIIIATRRRQKS